MVLLFGTSTLYYAAQLGTLFAGCGYVPLLPQIPVDRLRVIVSSTRPVCILTVPQFLSDELRSALDSASVPVLDVQTVCTALPTADHSQVVHREPVALSRTCYVRFTSGSTGVPKVSFCRTGLACLRAFVAVRASRSNAVWLGLSRVLCFTKSPACGRVLCAPLQWSFDVSEWRPLRSPRAAALCWPRTPNAQSGGAFCARVVASHITHICITPTNLQYVTFLYVCVC